MKDPYPGSVYDAKTQVSIAIIMSCVIVIHVSAFQDACGRGQIRQMSSGSIN